MRHIISVLLENESGALSRVVGLFSQRGYNIETLTVAPTEDPTLSRMTIVTMGDERVLEQIQKQLHKLVDVTIAYPGGVPSYWDFMCGRVKEIKVRVRFLPIERNLVGDYFNDPEFQQEFQQWLNGIWREKDQTLDKLLADKTQ